MAPVEFFTKGIMIGVIIAAPVGPIGILCIRRTLAFGRASGLISGLGAATADFIYGCVAAFGLTFISDFLIRESFWLRFVGGVFMLYLGGRIIKHASIDISPGKAASATNTFSNYFSTFVLTLTNPATIFSFLAIFAVFGVGNVSTSYTLATVLAIGVLLGSVIWWVLLSMITSLLRDRLQEGGLQVINTISGTVMIVFGLTALVTLL